MVGQFSMKRHRLFVLGSILLLSIGIRIYFWRDLGTLSWDGGAHSLGGVLLARTLLHLFDAPLQYAETFLASYWPTVGSLFFYPYGYDLLTAISYLIFGFNDFAARVPNIAASVLIFHPIFMISNYIYNERTGYVAAVFGAITPYFISWGGRAAVDVPMVFLTTYAIYYLLKANDTGNRRAWLTGGFLLGCASLFKPTAIILGAPLFGTAILLNQANLKNKWYYLGGVVGLLTFSTYIMTGVLAQLLFPGIGERSCVAHC